MSAPHTSSLRTTLGAGACLVIFAVFASSSFSSSTAASPEQASTPLSEQAPGLLRFVAKNRIATADGTFHEWSFTAFDVDPMSIETAEVTAEINIASIDTDSPRRDAHLRAADFFDVEHFPTATVRVFGAQRLREIADKFTARFEITIRGITKTLDGEFELTLDDPARVTGRLTLNRIDFEIGEPYSRWNPLSIQEIIPIEFTVERSLGAQ